MRNLAKPSLLCLIGGLVGCPTPSGPDAPGPGPQLGEPLGLEVPRAGITASELAVVVNSDDPLSAPIADAYMAARDVPADNRVVLALGDAPNLSREAFADVEVQLDAALGDDIQAIVLTSMTPQTVDCMATSAAFALGFDDSGVGFA